MRRFTAIAIGFLFIAHLATSDAHAQFGYPMGYGGYGMSQWGANPASGFMAGLGAYARGKGVYELNKAQADAINVKTMEEWNKALRARQIQLQLDKERKAAQDDAARAARVENILLRNGTTLNRLLHEILDSEPGVTRASRTQAPISTEAILEIPFEWDSEAISMCIDQMMAKDALPDILMRPTYSEDRQALESAVKPALAEDVKGTVSMATRKNLDEAISKFRAKFLKTASDFEAGYYDGLEYFTTMASLSRLLNDPSMKAFLDSLEKGQERTVGQLIAFMNSYNVRFGPATTDRQVEIYHMLVPELTRMRDAAVATRVGPTPPDASGEKLRAAAKNAFKGMPWDQLEAHGRTP
jgi:hypothetical protein